MDKNETKIFKIICYIPNISDTMDYYYYRTTGFGHIPEFKYIEVLCIWETDSRPFHYEGDVEKIVPYRVKRAWDENLTLIADYCNNNSIIKDFCNKQCSGRGMFFLKENLEELTGDELTLFRLSCC